MTPVTPHQPLPSHWYISEARGLSLSRSKLVSLEFHSKTCPDGADRTPSIGRSTDALSPRPRSLLLRRQPAAAAKDDDWLSTAALDEVRSPPEGAGLRHRPPSSPHSNHPCGGYNLRPRRMRTSCCQSMARKAMQSPPWCFQLRDKARMHPLSSSRSIDELVFCASFVSTGGAIVVL